MANQCSNSYKQCNISVRHHSSIFNKLVYYQINSGTKGWSDENDYISVFFGGFLLHCTICFYTGWCDLSRAAVFWVCLVLTQKGLHEMPAHTLLWALEHTVKHYCLSWCDAWQNVRHQTVSTDTDLLLSCTSDRAGKCALNWMLKLHLFSVSFDHFSAIIYI